MPKSKYVGLLFIVDPHLSSRIPGFRKDDYPQIILGKVRWCLEYACDEGLLPVIAGDLFHYPRDNANWLLGEVLDLFGRQEVVGIPGNHDCRVNELQDDDTFSVVVKAGKLTLLSADNTWRGELNGRSVILGGTPWGQWLPSTFDAGADDTIVAWVTHHDVSVPGYEGRFKPHSIPGVDLVVNGHIHRRLPDVSVGKTSWLTPGGIARVSRGDATHDHVPAALQIDVNDDGWQQQFREIPHKPFDEVFHEEVVADDLAVSESAFVQGLAELQARRTDTGAGLMAFLVQNLGQFTAPVAKEIRTLAEEVTNNDKQEG